MLLLIKIGSTDVTQNWSTSVTRNGPQKGYSKLVSRVLLETDPEVLLEINTQTLLKLTHKRYSDWSTSVTQIDPETLLKSTNITQIDPQTLLRLIHKRYTNWPTNVTRNKPTKDTQIDPQTLLKLTHKCYSKLVSQAVLNLKTWLQRLHD